MSFDNLSRQDLQWPLTRRAKADWTRLLAAGGFHQDAEGLGFGGGSGAVEVGGAAGALHIAVGVHLAAGGGAQGVGGVAVVGGEPAGQDSFIHGIGKHLGEIGLDEGFGPVNDVVKEAVRELIAEAAVNDVLGKGGKAFAILFLGGREAADDAGETGGGPSVAATPEVGVLELAPGVVPDVREELLFRVPEAAAEAL